MSSIEWRVTLSTSRALRACAYVALGAVGSLPVLGAALVAVLAVRALQAGNPGGALVVVAVAVLSVPLSRRYLLPVLLDPRVRDASLHPDARALHLRWLLGAAVAWGVVFVRAASVSPALPIALFAGALGLLVVAAGLRTEARVDPSSLTLRTGSRTTSLSGLRTVRSLRLGPLVLCWLSFERDTVSPRATRFLPVPSRVFPAVQTAFEDGVEATPDRGRAMPSAQRAVVLALGAALVAVGPALWVLLPQTGDARLVAAYAGALFGLLGVLALWYGTLG
jgi:hypothetical protein